MSLPIHVFRSQILAAIQGGPVTVITAETGAGKSTQVPQYLLEAGMRVLVTQPRRLAASSVAARVAEERGCILGAEVGFRTARDAQVSDRTGLLFCTDGLALVREMLGARRSYDVLIVDEVHEWNTNIEILIAWAMQQIRSGARFKLVLMSATLEAERLAKYCDSAPVVRVPGRTFPVTIEEPRELAVGESEEMHMADVIGQLVRKGRNTLVFLPGKKEIQEMATRLGDLPAEICPLHGEMSREDQRGAFARYARPKVVLATNVAQTSITIDDIDAVVDSCLERRIEVSGGVEGLYLRPISRADQKQRMGRAGRVRPGVYVPCGPELVRDFPVPEIQRTLLDQVVLRTAVAGFDLEELDIFHAPAPGEIHRAVETLQALKCMDDDRQVTDLGRRVSRLPVGVRTGAMLLEAERRGVLDRVMTIAACVETGGVVDGRVVDDRSTPEWKKLIAGQTQSDHLAMEKVFAAAQRLPRKDWRKRGIQGRRMSEAIQMRRQLERAIKRQMRTDGPSRGTDTDVLCCVTAGLVDQLRARGKNRWGEWVYGDDARRLGRESCLAAGQDAAQLVVGMPFDVKGKKSVVGLLQFVSCVDPAWLSDVAPHLVTEHWSEPRYSRDRDQVERTRSLLLRGARVATETVPTHDPAVFTDWIADEVMSGAYYTPVLQPLAAEQRKAQEMNARIGADVFDVGTREQLREFVARVVERYQAQRLADILSEAWQVAVVSEKDRARVLRDHPDSLLVSGEWCRVSYEYTPPRVFLSHLNPSANIEDVPDEVRTPGGRVLEMEIPTGWRGLSSTSGVKLREMLREHKRQQIFRAWVNRPEVDGDDVVTCKLDGEFEVYGARPGAWFLDREEAEGYMRDMLLREAEEELYPLRYRLPYEHALRDIQKLSTVTELRQRAEEIRAELAASETAEQEREARKAACVADVMQACADEGDEPDDWTALSVYRFVQNALELPHNSAERVATILEDEEQRDYGRDRRWARIQQRLGVDDSFGLDWKYGADVVYVAAYARHLARNGKKTEPVSRETSKAPLALAPEQATLGDLIGKFNRR
jgi:HrpA-like RNA helicase